MPIDTKALMKQVGKIRIFTSRLVDEHLSGDYHSVFKGQGIEFDQVREYVPGDDIRSIDWNVTARMGHPFIKRYSEERELTIFFVVDISGSHSFGSQDRSKAELAAELTCLLALSAVKNQDKVGLILFSDKVDTVIPPRKGRKTVMRLVREVLAAGETRRGTSIANALRFLNQIQKRKAIVFLISDFLDQGFEQELRITNRKHDVVCCAIGDPREATLPDVGLIDVLDPETGELVLLDTSSRTLRDAFTTEAAAREQKRLENFRRAKIDSLDISTARPFVDEVRHLFKKRQLRGGRR
jgi:uncharacterized protein (DUF58 family)